MKALVMKGLTQQALADQARNRPTVLFDDLLKRIESAARDGYDYINFSFSDPQEIVDRVLAKLKNEGFTWSRQSGFITIK